jgi:hypothetical protein
MTTVVNNSPSGDGDSSNGLLMGIIVFVILLFVVGYFALPMMRGADVTVTPTPMPEQTETTENTDNTDINVDVPDVNVNVTQVPQDVNVVVTGMPQEVVVTPTP